VSVTMKQIRANVKAAVPTLTNSQWTAIEREVKASYARGLETGSAANRLPAPTDEFGIVAIVVKHHGGTLSAPLLVNMQVVDAVDDKVLGEMLSTELRLILSRARERFS
jgi:hypothetical protein